MLRFGQNRRGRVRISCGWPSIRVRAHGYQRACDLTIGQASIGPDGSPVFACAGKTELPSRLILSQTSVGKAIRYTIGCSSLWYLSSGRLGDRLIVRTGFEGPATS